MHRTPQTLAAAVALFAVIFAGCTDDAAPTISDDVAFEDVKVASGKGLIRGVVVDSGIAPIDGATVTVMGLELTVTTEAEGTFIFTDIEPGNHFLTVEKPGWSQVQQGVLVEADVEKPAIVRVMLEAMPGTEPRAETLFVEGFIKCGAGTPATFHDCEDVAPDDRSTVSVMYEGAPDHVQVETRWTSTQPSGEQLYLVYFYCSDACESRDGRWSEGNRESPWVARDSAPPADNEAGVYASPGGPANGTGTSIDQRFDVYVTLFYNIAEPDPEWTFIEDGEYPV